jgi:hypothetical protein
VAAAGHRVATGGHWVSRGGHVVVACRHFVRTGGHLVSTGGHTVTLAWHFEASGGHLVSTMGHRVSAACVHLVGTGGHRVSTAGQLVGATADAVSSGVGVMRIGGAVVSAANAGETIQARRPITTAPTRQQPVVLCIRILPSEMDTRPPRQSSWPAGGGVPTGVIITPKSGPVKTGNSVRRLPKRKTPPRPRNCRKITPRTAVLCSWQRGTGHL